MKLRSNVMGYLPPCKQKKDNCCVVADKGKNRSKSTGVFVFSLFRQK